MRFVANELESLYKTPKLIIEQITGPENGIFHKNVVIYDFVGNCVANFVDSCVSGNGCTECRETTKLRTRLAMKLSRAQPENLQGIS